jgi:hypothetical protein
MAKIFISYSRSDANTVSTIIDRLNTAGHEVWVDRIGIRGGEKWRQQIVHAIEESDVIVLVLSKNSIASDNVRKEIDLAEGSKIQIIPLLLQQVDIPASIKYQLAGIQQIDLYTSFERGLQDLLDAIGEEQRAAPARIEERKPFRPFDGWHPSNRAVFLSLAGIVVLGGILGAFLFKDSIFPPPVELKKSEPIQTLTLAATTPAPSPPAPTSPTPTTAVPTTAVPTTAVPTSIAEAGLIAFNSSRAGNNDVYVMNIDGSGVTRITHGPYDERVPAWSPDGRQIAYQSNEGGSYNLTVYNLDTGRARQVTSTDCNDYNPVWSPDGEWLAFYSDCDGNREIYVIRSDGSGRDQLTHTSSINNWFPNWSPDGKQITFSSNRSGRYEVYIMNADGSGVRALALGCVSAFSPDGQYLVFAQYCTDTGQIYLIRADGTGLRTLLEEENNANPSWSPDGEWVLFQSERTGDEEIFMIRLDGSELKQLTFDPGRDSAPVWQPVPVPFPEGMRAKVRDGETLTAGYLSSPPQIDGRLDEWRLPRVPVTAVVFEEANHSGPADLSAELMLGWDEGYLYIALDIRDDRYVQNATGDKLFQGDYIDILLDTELEADFSDEKLSDDDFQIGLSLGSDLRAPENYLWYPINRKGEKTGLKFAGLLTLRGYTVEIAIPWKIFLLEPLSGGIYGFALSIGDDDLVDINRLETMVSTVPNRKLTNPTTWGNLSLEKAP